MRSNSSRSARTTVRATAFGSMPAKRSAISAGARRMLSRLPRRSCSQPSSDVRQRIATSASWSSVRRGAWACTFPVAIVVDAEMLGEVAQSGVTAGVAPFERALQLDEKAVAAEGAGEPRQPRSDRARQGLGGRSRRGRRARLRAPPAGLSRRRAAGARVLATGRRVPACASVRMLAEVRVARGSTRRAGSRARRRRASPRRR